MPVRRLLAWVSCSFLVLVAACAPRAKPVQTTPKAAPAIRLVSSRWPPFTDVEDAPHVAEDLVHVALARAGYRTTSEIVPMVTLLDSLREGRADGSAALWRSPEREAFLLYSDPYLENRLLLVGRQGSDTSATSFGELAGKKIGIVEGYAYGPALDEAKEPEFVRRESIEENFRALLHGELDYVLADALVIQHLVESYPEKAREKLAVGSHVFVRRTLHLAVRNDLPQAVDLISRFNREIKRMLQDGAYHRALAVDWIVADFDGDGQPELIAKDARVGKVAPTRGYQIPGPALAGGPGPSDHGDEVTEGAHFVIKGVAYDSWQAVPDEYKTETDNLSAKPRTLRVEIFDF